MKPYLPTFIFIFLPLVFGCASSKVQVAEAAPQVVLAPESNQDSAKDVKDKGWSHLLELLVTQGIERKTAEKALGSRDMPEKEILEFNLKPKEKHSIYRGVNTAKRRAHAYEFYLAHI